MASARDFVVADRDERAADARAGDVVDRENVSTHIAKQSGK
jgi:hypothetical protein